MASTFARIPLIMSAAAAVVTMVAGTAQAAPQPAHATAGPASVARPAVWGAWIQQGPYRTQLACDDQWTSVSSQGGVQATYCEYTSANPPGWFFDYRVWF
jgi:hypothetical protein